MLKKLEIENRDGKEVKDEVLGWLRTRSIKMIVEEPWEKVADLETKFENLDLPEKNDQNEVLQEFVEILVKIARVWHMDDDNEGVKEDDDDGNEVSRTDDDWVNLESPTLGDSQEYPDMMGGDSMETVADHGQEEPHVPKGWNRA